MPGGFNLVAGPVTFQVNEEDLEEAKELLEGLQASEEDVADNDSLPEEDA